jgi:hypothetical protein
MNDKPHVIDKPDKVIVNSGAYRDVLGTVVRRSKRTGSLTVRVEGGQQIQVMPYEVALKTTPVTEVLDAPDGQKRISARAMTFEGMGLPFAKSCGSGHRYYKESRRDDPGCPYCMRVRLVDLEYRITKAKELILLGVDQI